MSARTAIHFRKSFFGEAERVIAEAHDMTAALFRYDSGIEAVRLTNRRGHLVVLPYYGQMVWDAVFDGVDLTMANMFDMPRHATEIVGTYGCFAFHSGLLRNGCPGPQDSHPLHGEMPCAPMDTAGLEVGEDDEGPYMAVTGLREYVMGFGAHYMARPRVVLRPGSTLFDIQMAVENRSGAPMDLMYMCHVNFAFAEGARIVQPAPFTPQATAVRTVVPAHVPRSPGYDALLEALARDPAVMEVLDEPHRYDPEQVFYIRGLRTDGNGDTALMLRRREGDAFHIAYNTQDFPRTVRWVLVNSDQKVCAFALPATCEPEGFTAERAKGNLQTLKGGETRRFSVRLGYLAAEEADAAEHAIRAL
ncbi:aldose 1-epimerase family protein [Azospirillum sp. TSO35-2]|uniref:aldose 1-epimerase family protein n=1 Tax=Azospirillum sp. TSO35-2 TaxID=716796 RepID=UPI000D6149EE|nr:aldose 1-epimerase family protein [Azospirillum sp. TSO35-2]PWC36069.1 deoxyribose mutarotase [Azospirillum sp. TSO35-2]